MTDRTPWSNILGDQYALFAKFVPEAFDFLDKLLQYDPQKRVCRFSCFYAFKLLITECCVV
jgi:hypothetical protein